MSPLKEFQDALLVKSITSSFRQASDSLSDEYIQRINAIPKDRMGAFLHELDRLLDRFERGQKSRRERLEEIRWMPPGYRGGIDD